MHMIQRLPLRSILIQPLKIFSLQSRYRSISFFAWTKSIFTPEPLPIKPLFSQKPQEMTMTSSLSPIPPPPATRKLEAKDGALVWIDCEMTGLDFENDQILEISCIITDGQLRKVDEGVNYIIKTDQVILDKMNDWCKNQHGKSGLTKSCLDETKSFSHEQVRNAILTYIRDRIPHPYHACLAGNTVHADAKFLSKEMPEIISHLHYRIVDVSSIKELVSRWYGEDKRYTGGKGNHRALDDIRNSIEELQYYRKRFFVKQ